MGVGVGHGAGWTWRGRKQPRPHPQGLTHICPWGSPAPLIVMGAGGAADGAAGLISMPSYTWSSSCPTVYHPRTVTIATVAGQTRQARTGLREQEARGSAEQRLLGLEPHWLRGRAGQGRQRAQRSCSRLSVHQCGLCTQRRTPQPTVTTGSLGLLGFMSGPPDTSTQQQQSPKRPAHSAPETIQSHEAQATRSSQQAP